MDGIAATPSRTPGQDAELYTLYGVAKRNIQGNTRLDNKKTHKNKDVTASEKAGDGPGFSGAKRSNAKKCSEIPCCSPYGSWRAVTAGRAKIVSKPE
jgi:hypothetical protein